MAILTKSQCEFITQKIKHLSIDQIANILQIQRHLVYGFAYRKALIKAKKYTKIRSSEFEKIVLPDRKKEPLKRHPPVYTNSKSPFGIADNLMLDHSFDNNGILRRILK